MHILFVGGTKWVGLEAAKRARAEGHTVTIAHSGAHGALVEADVTHLHGSREALFAPGGPIESARADVIVDTFGATRERGAKSASAPCAAMRALWLSVPAMSTRRSREPSARRRQRPRPALEPHAPD